MTKTAEIEMSILEEGRSPPQTSGRENPHPTEEVDPVPNRDRFSRILIGLSYFLITITFPITIWWCIVTVQEFQRGVWLRLGRLREPKSVGPGVYIKIPWIDTIILVDMRVKTLNVVPQSVSHNLFVFK